MSACLVVVHSAHIFVLLSIVTVALLTAVPCCFFVVIINVMRVVLPLFFFSLSYVDLISRVKPKFHLPRHVTSRHETLTSSCILAY